MANTMNARLGIDLGGSKIAGVVLDARDRVIAQRRVMTPQGDYGKTLEAIAALVGDLERSSGVADLSVGMGTPGSIDPRTGCMRNANSRCLNGQPLLADMQTVLRRPVRIANDADCLALSEQRDGAAAGAASVFAVILGTGVGGGLVCGGQLHVGHNGLAGEWGHNPLPWALAAEMAAAPCWCGLRGCLETWLSGSALVTDYCRRGGASRSAVAITAAAAAGERLAEDALAAWCGRLARALAQVINLLDPEVIVVGGGLSQIERLYVEVPRRWQDYVFADDVSTPLRRARHGDASGVRGAARLWPLPG